MGYFLRLGGRTADPTRDLLEASRQLNSTLDVSELCRILARSAARLAGGEGCCAGLREAGVMRCKVLIQGGRLRQPGAGCRPDLRLPGRLLDCRKALIDNRAGQRPGYGEMGARSAVAVPLCDANDEVIGFFEVFNKPGGFEEGDVELLRAMGDIASTAIQNALAYDRLKRSEAAMREANEQMEALTYSVAHDLRGPLRGITSFSDLLLARHARRLDEEGRRHLERIRCASVKLSRLLDDILSLARVSRQPLKPRRVCLSAVVEELVEDFRRADPRRRVDVTVQPELWATCDAQLITVALRQLLHNAWKFSAQRSDARIRFEADKDGYCVRDNGLGFKQEYAPTLFAPFQKLGVGLPGTGIGLALVHRIVRRHGGRCWAEGDEGKGASFYFTLGRL